MELMDINKFSTMVSEKEHVYVILDAAQKPGVAYKPYEFQTEWISLYHGTVEEAISDVAPYLLSLSYEHADRPAMLRWIFEECWGNGCALFFSSKSDLMTLQKYFQKNLSVFDAYGKALSFRFYDPTVWRAYLPTCNQDELELWFQYSDWYAVEGEDFEQAFFYSKNEYVEVRRRRVFKNENLPLIIRGEQSKAFEKSAIMNFENDMVKYVDKYFTKHYEILGEKQIREVIQYACRRSEKYRITTRRNVCLYLSLMLMLGGNFDEDVQLSWVSEILNDQAITDQSEKIDKLYDTAMVYIEKVFGKDGEHTKEALNRIKDSKPRFKPPPCESKTFGEYMCSQFQYFFPKKYRESGIQVSYALICQGVNSAKKYGVTEKSELMIYILFMFMLGSGFDTDPQLPWVTEILSDDAMGGQAKRVDLLYKKALEALKVWLS